MAQRNGWKMRLGKKPSELSEPLPSLGILSPVSGWSAGSVATLWHISVRSEVVMSQISL